MDSKFDAAIHALVSRLGWSYSSKTIADLRERLKVEEFFIDESGEIVSPSGESLGSAVGRLWEEGPPPGAKSGASIASTSEDAERARYGGFTEADFKALPYHKQHAVLEEVAGKSQAVESWRKNNAPVSVGEIVQRTGLSAEAFAALPVERRLEIENEVKFSRGVRS